MIVSNRSFLIHANNSFSNYLKEVYYFHQITFQVIILDEIHERNLSGDFLLGLLRNLVRRRDDLKLILMSATINLELFQNYFDDSPVIKVSFQEFKLNFNE